MEVKLQKIFIAAANDVATAFEYAESAIDTLNKLYTDIINIRFEIHKGKDAYPSMGRPEGQILGQMPMEKFDFFIGILWSRFGTPTNEINPLNKNDFQSGTEEEFYSAFQSYTSSQKPHILIYNCKKDLDYDKIDIEQFSKVKTFLKKFHPDGEHPGLFKSYKEVNEFEKFLLFDLHNIVKKDFQIKNYEHEEGSSKVLAKTLKSKEQFQKQVSQEIFSDKFFKLFRQKTKYTTTDKIEMGLAESPIYLMESSDTIYLLKFVMNTNSLFVLKEGKKMLEFYNDNKSDYKNKRIKLILVVKYSGDDIRIDHGRIASTILQKRVIVLKYNPFINKIGNEHILFDT